MIQQIQILNKKEDVLATASSVTIKEERPHGPDYCYQIGNSYVWNIQQQQVITTFELNQTIFTSPYLSFPSAFSILLFNGFGVETDIWPDCYIRSYTTELVGIKTVYKTTAITQTQSQKYIPLTPDEKIIRDIIK